VPDDPYQPGYKGNPAAKTSYCVVCGERKDVHSGFSRREVWHGDTLCNQCADTTVPVTFHAAGTTWSERMPREEAGAIAPGDVLTAADVSEAVGLAVARVEEYRGPYARAGTPETHVWLRDQSPRDDPAS
jgi:hypothetical protein